MTDAVEILNLQLRHLSKELMKAKAERDTLLDEIVKIADAEIEKLENDGDKHRESRGD